MYQKTLVRSRKTIHLEWNVESKLILLIGFLCGK